MSHPQYIYTNGEYSINSTINNVFEPEDGVAVASAAAASSSANCLLGPYTRAQLLIIVDYKLEYSTVSCSQTEMSTDLGHT